MKLHDKFNKNSINQEKAILKMIEILVKKQTSTNYKKNCFYKWS
jgi:hypothetical protein